MGGAFSTVANLCRTPFENLRKRRSLARFAKNYIADRPVDLEKFGEFRKENFPGVGPYSWLDRPDALFAIDERLQAGVIDEEQAEICRKWVVDGYVVLRRLLPQETLDAIWTAYEKAIAAGVIAPPAESMGPGDDLPGRALDPHLLVPEIKEAQRDPRILAVTDLLFGRKTLPFQTIMGHKGSGQAAHSDSIHMTTYPYGWLIANWIALEDVAPDSGPLEYYPRSHRLAPPMTSVDVGIEPLAFKYNPGVYSQKYEPAVARTIAAFGLQRETFLASAGDVLFWSANLLHGGAARRNPTLSRKALVCHYFAEGVVTYHDLSGNPSRLHRRGWRESPVAD
jgi:hypothetical protein